MPRGVRDFTWATCCDKAEAYSGCMQEVEHSSSSSVARKQRQTERGTCPSNAHSKTPHTPTRLHLLPSSHHLLEITALRHRLSEPFKVCKDTEQSLGDPSPHDFFLQDSDYKVRRFHQHGKQQSCRMCWAECGCRPQAGPITLVCVRK